MSKEEISELLHKCIYEDYDTYETEFHQKIQHMVSLINPESEEQAEKITQALLDYTYFINEKNCASMVRFLSSMEKQSASPSSN